MSLGEYFPLWTWQSTPLSDFLFLGLWVGAAALQVLFGIVAARQDPGAAGKRRPDVLSTSAAAATVPLATLLMFLFGITFGYELDPSNLSIVANVLFIANALVVPVLLVAALLPPYPPRLWMSCVSRMAAVIAAGCALSSCQILEVFGRHLVWFRP